jgi:hypothetical protein
MGIRRGSSRKGIPHKMTAARAAQLQRWQMMGANARKGQRTAQRSLHHASKARGRKEVVRPIAKAVAWGVSKTALPTQLVAPFIPGYQPGDRTYTPPKRKKR